MQVPKTILSAGVFLIFYPIVNLFGIAFYYKNFSLDFLSKNISIVQFILIFFPVIIGIGLIRIQKWAWYSFLIYAILLIGFNFYGAIKNPVLFNYISILEVIVVSFLIAYFLRKDISSPYFKLYPRGWRGEKRKPIQKNLLIDNISKTTRDFSEAGFYVDWDNPNLELNSEVTVEIKNGSDKQKFPAGVVRIDSNGVGFAFRRLTKEDRVWLGEVV
ncbi:MAG: PilZ domain-containing protein [Leptospiraceae bacterium]|nr:PilZ domain-containing protein [Leptospiraceae bacterium]